MDRDLPFLSERMKINKCKKLICNLSDKNKYVQYVNMFNSLILKKVHRVISFNQKYWMKEYILTNIEERKKADSDF